MFMSEIVYDKKAGKGDREDAPLLYTGISLAVFMGDNGRDDI